MYFVGLVSDEEATRLQASYKIVSGLDGAPTPDVQSALSRLLKGLSSGRKSARLGFSVTLTEVLVAVSCLSCCC